MFEVTRHVTQSPCYIISYTNLLCFRIDDFSVTNRLRLLSSMVWCGGDEYYRFSGQKWERLAVPTPYSCGRKFNHAPIILARCGIFVHSTLFWGKRQG